MRIVARIRRGLATRRARGAANAGGSAAGPGVARADPGASRATGPARPGASPPPPLRGLGEPPAGRAPAPDAGEAELDTLRGELVRELDRMAEGDDGSGSFRRIAS